MKEALTLLKWFNHLWTVNLSPEQEAEQILKYLLLKNSTSHSIEIYQALKIAMQCEMRKREFEAQSTLKSINAVWHRTTEP